MRRIIEVSCDEDGENFFVVGDVTRLGALRAINKFMRQECGLDGEELPKLDDLEVCNFWETDDEKYEGGEYEGWHWWSKPKDVPVKPVGRGWRYSI